ncbi:MAG: tetratricopeptide repeat protein [Candidatus Melainabacteria bacterium]|nr:tetratricopeptide repeat protein [Candidatus Melainabacteria bacterium]
MEKLDFKVGGKRLIIDRQGVTYSSSGIFGSQKHQFSWSEVEKVVEVVCFARGHNSFSSEYFPGDQTPVSGTKTNEYLLIDTTKASFKIYYSDFAPTYSFAPERGYEELRVILKAMVPDKVTLQGYVYRSGGKEMCDITMALARFFHSAGNLSAAQEAYTKAHYWAMHYHNETHPFVVEALNGLNEILIASGQDDAAKALEIRAQAINSAQAESVEQAYKRLSNELHASPDYQNAGIWEKAQLEQQLLKKLKRELEKKKHV